VADTTGWGNFIVELGNNPGLMMVVKMPVMVRIDEPADAYGSWISASADYGVAVVSQDRALQCISRT